MLTLKPLKAERVNADIVAENSMNVVKEMLDIIVERTNSNGDYEHTGDMQIPLHYFGEGKQLKISKVGDSLYTSLNDVLEFVMLSKAKKSDSDLKFQMPKHTSYIGSIVKNTAIDVISRNEDHIKYIDSLISRNGKYRFNASCNRFRCLYYDVVLRLYDRGYLFDDDPELDEVRKLIDNGLAQVVPNPSGNAKIILLFDENGNNKEEAKFHVNARYRVIFPYIRRLFETHRSTTVTKKRVSNLNNQVQPDEEIKHMFYTKYEEAMNNCADDVKNNNELLCMHCQFIAISALENLFSKERIDKLKAYLKSGPLLSVNAHKRYITIPAVKRQRLEETISGYEKKTDEEGKEGPNVMNTVEYAFNSSNIKSEESRLHMM